MGHIEHDAVIVTGGVWSADEAPDVDAFRESLPEDWRQLIVGPITSPVNGYLSWVFLPDGSKSGWSEDRDGELYRRRFVELFAETYDDGSHRWDVVELTYGADHRYEFGEPSAVYAEPEPLAPSNAPLWERP
jgi:hypothetical protein